MLDHIKELYNRLGYPDHEAIYHTLVGNNQYDALKDYMKRPDVIELFFGAGVKPHKPASEVEKESYQED